MEGYINLFGLESCIKSSEGSRIKNTHWKKIPIKSEVLGKTEEKLLLSYKRKEYCDESKKTNHL